MSLEAKRKAFNTIGSIFKAPWGVSREVVSIVEGFVYMKVLDGRCKGFVIQMNDQEENDRYLEVCELRR